MTGRAKRIYDATWGRAFAAMYDRALASTEEAGLEQTRRELLAGAEGRVLELGAGTGLNLPHYRPGTELILLEPFGPMATRLRDRAAELGIGAQVIEAPAEEIPLPNDSVDTVVSTLVLCTVDDPAATLAEIARVLRPGGRLLFCEHVRSEDPKSARWQDRLERPWKFFGHGCRCNRDTVGTIGASPLEIDWLERGRMPKAAAIVRPLVTGSARL